MTSWGRILLQSVRYSHYIACSLSRQTGKTHLSKMSWFLGTSTTIRALENFLLGYARDGIRNTEDWEVALPRDILTQSTREEGLAKDTQLLYISFSSGPVPMPTPWSPTICPSPHCPLKAGKPSELVLFLLLHHIAQSLMSPLVALCQSLPTWSSWARLPSAWRWWVATPAALPWSSHPHASLSPWWCPAGVALACSCLSSFPETGDTKSAFFLWIHLILPDNQWYCNILPVVHLHTLCFKIGRSTES